MGGEVLEHRWRKRSRVSLDVRVCCRDGTTLYGRACDLSPDGMFIRLAGQSLSTSAMVEVELPGGGRLRGRVLHASDEGIGVMFGSVGGRERRLLRWLLADAATVE